MIIQIRVLVVALSTMVGCSAESRTLPDSTRARPAGVASAPVDRDGELEQNAKRIVAFLRGDAAFETIGVADTVRLYLSPEGGGTETALAREQLRDPSLWVRTRIRHVSSLRSMTSGNGSSAHALLILLGENHFTERCGD